MLTLTDMIDRSRIVLDDPTALRFSDNLLQEAAAHAMQTLSDRLPRQDQLDFILTVDGRDQTLSGISSLLYLVEIRLIRASDVAAVLEPDLHFTYRMVDGQPVIHFLGDRIPRAGDTLQVVYAANQTLQGLQGALTTTLPDGASTAFVNGIAGHACLLRSHTLLEAGGVRQAEIDRMLQLARLRLDLFEKNLADLRIFQEFGFPPGFKLDQWDHRGPF